MNGDHSEEGELSDFEAPHIRNEDEEEGEYNAADDQAMDSNDEQNMQQRWDQNEDDTSSMAEEEKQTK